MAVSVTAQESRHRGIVRFGTRRVPLHGFVLRLTGVQAFDQKAPRCVEVSLPL